jgi:dephospho-CoA kinase
MMWIGLTGGIASGKSRVSKILLDKGLVVIDADAVAREVVKIGSPGLKQVEQYFGPQYICVDGSLNRQKLGELIFSDENMRVQLENILHPLIRKNVAEQKQILESKKIDVAFYDVPLLFEKQMQAQFDKVLVVSCSYEQQISRLQSRDHLTRDQAIQRLKSQMSLDDKVKLADFTIDNSKTLDDLQIEVEKTLNKIMSLKKSPTPGIS